MHNGKWQVFDRYKKPVRQNPVLLPLIWAACYLATRSRHLKIRKINMEGLKPPYLVLSTHHSFTDFYVAPLALFPHRANYISELEGFEGKEWLYRQIGCLCKRKFTNDVALIRNIQYVTGHHRDSIVIYPEARYCNVGTQSSLPNSVGKLAKLLNIPVVMLHMRGNYLMSPIWNLKKRKVRLEADLVGLLHTEETQKLGVHEINQAISESFRYDDYRWQQEMRIRIDYPKRAEGLHRVLYHCVNCHQEHQMIANGAVITCKACQKSWEMTEYGELRALEGETLFSHIPDWYEFQRDIVKREIQKQSYCSASKVRIVALPGAKGFIELGAGYVRHDCTGYRLEYQEGGEGRILAVSPIEMTSVHTEYNYRGKWGECITLSTLENTYFLYPEDPCFNVTKVQFATEELYLAAKNEKKRAE